MGTGWRGSEAEQVQIAEALDAAAAWAEANGRPLFLGEFGAYKTGEMADRVAWTTFVRQAAEERSISWAYWEFAAGFGVYDQATRRWRVDFLAALLGES